MLPPTLDELVPADHQVRLIAELVDGLPRPDWEAMEVVLASHGRGPAAYHPRALLGVWLYGFMVGIRSSRKLETACYEQLPLLWLTGGQRPDHNTLWRFYQAHRKRMRTLLKRVVRVAVDLGLVDWALQAVDGTKVAGNAAKKRTLDAAELTRLLERTDVAIADLEAQNCGGEEPARAGLPQALQEAKDLRQRVQAALKQCEEEEHRVNLTDPDTRLMKGRQGFVAGYNAQAAAMPVAKEAGGGLFITAALVTQQTNDHGQLLPVMHEAKDLSGSAPERTAADAGYLSGATLAACAAEGATVVIPDGHWHPVEQPYHKDQFSYDAAADSYTCPVGQVLPFHHLKHKRGEGEVRVYRGAQGMCLSCPAFGVCTTDRKDGRRVERTKEDAALQTHHAWMSTPEAKATAARRKSLIEPVFGILKEQMGARRFWLRGIENVKAEWTLLATAFNLRTLWRVLRRRQGLLSSTLAQVA
jgi:transposase